MARIFYGLNREDLTDVSKQPTRSSGATTGLNFEIAFDNAAGLTRKDAIEGCERMLEFLKHGHVTNALDSDFDL